MGPESDIWTLPVPALGPRVPVVSNGFRLGDHAGIDFGLRANYTDPPCDKANRRERICSKRNKVGFYNRLGTPVLAAGPGLVDRVWHQHNGWWVRLSHHDGMWRTLYGHLSLPVPLVRGQLIASGQPLGVMGPGEEVRVPPHNPWLHLHFAMRGPKLRSFVNPARYLKRWRIIEWTTEGGLRPSPFV